MVPATLITQIWTSWKLAFNFNSPIDDKRQRDRLAGRRDREDDIKERLELSWRDLGLFIY